MATDYKPMTPQFSAALGCTTSSQVIALPLAGENTVEFSGDSLIDIYVAFGPTNAVVAATPTTSFARDCHVIRAGTLPKRVTPPPNAQYLAYKSASGTPTLHVTQGWGQ